MESHEEKIMRMLKEAAKPRENYLKFELDQSKGTCENAGSMKEKYIYPPTRHCRSCRYTPIANVS